MQEVQKLVAEKALHADAMPTAQLGSQVLRQHWPCLEKTPKSEGKPAEAEQPWTWRQDEAAMRSADKYIYSFT